MSEETQLILAVIATLAQAYLMEPWHVPVFAYIWDFIATVSGILSNLLANIAMQARINYFAAVNSYGS